MATQGVANLPHRPHCATGTRTVIVLIVFAPAHVEHVHKGIFALMLHANDKAEVVKLVLGVVHDQNVFAPGAEHSADLELIFLEGDGDAV